MRWTLGGYVTACSVALMGGVLFGVLSQPNLSGSSAPETASIPQSRASAEVLRPTALPQLRPGAQDTAGAPRTIDAAALPLRDKTAEKQALGLRGVAAPPPSGLIAVIIDDLGLDWPRAVDVLDIEAPLTLSILPYGRYARDVAALAEARGNEIMLHMPMEPDGYDDPGPYALLTGLSPRDFRRRMAWSFKQFDGYVGLNNHMGSRLTRAEPEMRLVMAAAKARGLFFVDSLTSPASVSGRTAKAAQVPFARRDVFLDHDQGRAAVTRQLAQAEQIAKTEGSAIAIGHPHPQTLDVLAEWVEGLEAKNLEIVPASRVLAARTGRSVAALTGTAPTRTAALRR